MQSLLFNIAQQTVEIEVIELQIKVGGHEVGEVRVVVALVQLEQLVVPCWYDGKTVTSQLILQGSRIFLELHIVHHIIHIDTVAALAGYKVPFHQLLFACQQFVDESLLGLSGLHGHLSISLVVVVAVIFTLVVVYQIFNLLPAFP